MRKRRNSRPKREKQESLTSSNSILVDVKVSKEASALLKKKKEEETDFNVLQYIVDNAQSPDIK